MAGFTVSECNCTEDIPTNSTNIDPPYLDPWLSLTRSFVAHHFNEGAVSHSSEAASDA
jgi:hypothetical protein